MVDKLNRFLLTGLVILALIAGASAQIIYEGQPYDIASYENQLGKMTGSPISQGSVSDIVNTPLNGIVGESDNHTLTFIQPDSTIQPKSSILVTYPDNFDLETITDYLYTDSDPNNTDPLIDSVVVEEHTLRIYLDPLCTAPESGSSIEIQINGITNITVTGTYQLILAVTDSLGAIQSGPQFSEHFLIIGGDLDSIQISPDEVRAVRAGESLQFNCACYDSFDNVIDCPPKTWSVVSSGGTGNITHSGLFTGIKTGPFKIACAVDPLFDTTQALLFVTPGNFHTFELKNVPDTVIAGKLFESTVTVEAQDAYHNVVGSYEKQIWFVTGDTLAEFVFDSTNKYQFIKEEDNGRAEFTGENFTLHTAGLQSIHVRDADSVSPHSDIIVLPDQPAAFTVLYPGSITVGQAFDLEVRDLADASGNLLSGIVSVSLVNNGTAPDGTDALVNQIYVQNGTGLSSQKLFKAGTARFRLSIDTVTVTTDYITVLNGNADHFDFELASPQIVGTPFTGPATLTALDNYGNLVEDFDAHTDTVTIVPLDDGSVLNDTIGTANAFINGVCDLTDFEVGYDGPARFLKFKAHSKTGVEGISETIEINSSSIDRLSLSASSLYRGDQFVASVTISNYGSLPLTVDDLNLNSSQGEMVFDSVVPDIPDQITGNSSTTFEIYTYVPLTYISEMTYFSASFSGFYNQQTVSDVTGILDSLKVLSQQEATYVEHSLTPDILTQSGTYELRLALKNLGDNVISLTTDSYLQFASETDTFTAGLEVPTFLPTSGEDVDLFFEEKTIPEMMQSGTYAVELFLFGLQGGSSYSEELTLTDSIMIETPPAISFVEESLSPDSVFRGSEIFPEMSIMNEGEAFVVVDLDLSRLVLTSGGQSIVFRVDASTDTIFAGTNVLKFGSGRIPSDFPVGTNTLTLHLEGEANHQHVSFNLQLGDNLFAILLQGAVRILQVENMALNTPLVNTGQEFQVSVEVANLGQEILNDIWVLMSAEESTLESDSLMIESLEPEEKDTLYFVVTAAQAPTTAEIFRANVLSSIGGQTGEVGIILNPEDNTAVATIQTPAQLSTSLNIISPPDALGGTVNISQQFDIQVEFDNLGQADVDAGVARLTLPENFQTSQALFRSFEVGSPLVWSVIAPSVTTEGILSVDIYTEPIDQNTLEPAQLAKSADSVTVTVEEQLPTVSVHSQFESYTLLNAGQTLSALTLEFNTESLASGRRAILTDLTFDFTDRSGTAVSADDLLLSGTIHFGDQNFAGTLSGNQLIFDFGSDIEFDETTAAQLELELVLSNNLDLENFTISTDSSQVVAHDFSFGTVGGRLQVRSSTGQSFEIEKSYGTVPAEFESSFYNIPNPFNPDIESTQIVYYLPVNSEVQFNVYTLIGESVFSTTIPSGSSGGLGGRVNSFYWDGRNGEDLVVREGVYIAVLKYSGGETITKIAVVK